MLKMEGNSSYHHHQHHNNNLPSDPFSSPLVSTTAVDDVDVDNDQKTSLGFMELLGFQDHYYSYTPSSVFDHTAAYHQLPPAPPPPPSALPVEMDIPTWDRHLNRDDGGDIDDDHDRKVEIATVDEESSVVLNGLQPSSPNSSSICNSPAHQQLQNPIKQCIKEKKAMGGDETKAKKKKKEKAPRFAFMTRTEIDHLDDGYRWRKYGQKAVKNSRFPRSYYRCTNASCNVKKRVERCMGDPCYVITTYEGQHSHPVAPNTSPIIPSFNHLITNAAFGPTPFAASTAIAPPPAMLKLDQGGLLQDMLHCHH